MLFRHCLEQVRDPPHLAAGELRPADRAERRLLVDWTRAFSYEAGAELKRLTRFSTALDDAKSDI